MTSSTQRRSAAGFDIDRTIGALRSALPPDAAAAPLHQPCFAGKEWDYVKACLDSCSVSSAGSFVTPHAIAVVSGTAALHVCSRASAGAMRCWRRR